MGGGECSTLFPQARTLSTIILQPWDMCKTYQQAGQNPGILSSRLGRTAWWRGLRTTLIRDLPFTGIYWGGLCLGVKYGLVSGKNSEHKLDRVTSHGFLNSVWHNLCAPVLDPAQFWIAFSSATLATVVTHPLDVIKVHLQTFPRQFVIHGVGRARYESFNSTWTSLTVGMDSSGARTRTYKLLWTGLEWRLLRYGSQNNRSSSMTPPPSP